MLSSTMGFFIIAQVGIPCADVSAHAGTDVTGLDGLHRVLLFVEHLEDPGLMRQFLFVRMLRTYARVDLARCVTAEQSWPAGPRGSVAILNARAAMGSSGSGGG